MKIRISKKVKASKRGLTFSFEQGDTFRAGVHYRYIVDKHSNEIIIVPDTIQLVNTYFLKRVQIKSL